MPEIDGFEVCRQLKKNTKTSEIPIIFISGLNDIKDKIKAFTIGGVDFITKPFYKEEVCARVNIHLSIRKLQKELEEKNEFLLKKNDELELANSNIKTMTGLLPICANCKKIRNDQGYWTQIESYISNHTDALFSHSLCEPCAEELYGYKKKNIKTD
jgi:response regulator RpfG family c-di-GMP phosphodiesterase